MKVFTLMILLSGLLTSNCDSTKRAASKNQTQNITEDTNDNTLTRQEATEKDLFGSWEWVKTNCCGRISKTTMADPKDEKRVISFYKDGTADFYTQDPTGKIGKQKFTFSKMGTQTTVKIGELQPAIYTLKDDQLVLNWGYMDLQIEYYKRVSK